MTLCRHSRRAPHVVEGSSHALYELRQVGDELRVGVEAPVHHPVVADQRDSETDVLEQGYLREETTARPTWRSDRLARRQERSYYYDSSRGHLPNYSGASDLQAWRISSAFFALNYFAPRGSMKGNLPDLANELAIDG